MSDILKMTSSSDPGRSLPSCPQRCHLLGTFYKLYKIKSLTSFPPERPLRSIALPPHLYCRDKGGCESNPIPTTTTAKSLGRCMRLHINCIELGQPWASIAFMLNISEKYEMEITFSILAFPPKLCRDAFIRSIHHSTIALVWSLVPCIPSWEGNLQLAVRLEQ